MTSPPTSDAFFGLPLRMTRADAEQLLATLADAWETQYGALGTVERDLRTMHKRLFKPIARESTLREAIERAAQESAHDDLPEGLTVHVGGAQVITPEARVTIDVLERALADAAGDALDLGEISVAAERLLLDTYRAWCRERLHRVVAMAEGDDSPLLPGPLGLITMLLLEDATSPSAALVQARSIESDAIERSVVAGVVAFARVLDPDAEWDERHFALYGGYALTEARRRLSALVLEPPGRRPSATAPPKRVFIRAGERQAVMAFIARDLRRRGIDAERIRQALNAALETHAELAEPERARRARERAPELLAALSAGLEDDAAGQAPH